MCGRYTLRTDPEVLAQVFDLTEAPRLQPRFNIAPTQDVAVLAGDQPSRVQLFRWGLVPSWAKDPAIGNKMINARGETLAEKPSFRTALKKRRCLVLADGFFEWRPDGKRKTPMYIRKASEQPFAIAGLWETWRAPDGAELRSCTLITTQPSAMVAQIHDRMPVLLAPATWARWLGPEALAPEELAALLVPYDGEDLVAYPVSALVNMPANDVPACIRPA
ncbi:MAG: SOS response-associated peptidase [Myxococcaceae bacterium]|nr:SOS response-associated peptidase [Myxococcaceae bacterium]MCI0671690.1 SOS response-associated peptidase [Myxococcaceae bacterium]